MGVYLGPKCRLCRREGMRLFLKGDKCYTAKCAVEKRKYPPGMHGQNQRKIEDYGLQLREKQKLKRIYFVLERPFRNYFAEAERRQGLTGEMLLQILEMRLDNVVYRMGFARSRKEARQLVSHGHFLVNDKKVNIPSYQTRPGEAITAAPGSRDSAPMRLVGHGAAGRRVPEWLDFDLPNLQGRVVTRPTREQIDTDVEEQLVVEFYSR